MANKSFLQVPGRELGGADDKVEDSNDKYTAAIELSNKCREFYKSRLEAANIMKSKWREHTASQTRQHSADNEHLNHNISVSPSSSASLSSSSSSSSLSSSASSSSSSTSKSSSNVNEHQCHSKRGKTSIDIAMERLRSEMVSLMDQDLSLMKQLLTLNETIEELKWQRQYYSCSTSCGSLSASKNLDSNWSVSETEMYDSEDDLKALTHASSNSNPSSHVTGPTWHSTRKVRKASKEFEKISLDSVVGMNIDCASYGSNRKTDALCGDSKSKNVEAAKSSDQQNLHCDEFMGLSTPIIIHERDQNSFDSGIHEEPSCIDELGWTV